MGIEKRILNTRYSPVDHSPDPRCTKADPRLAYWGGSRTKRPKSILRGSDVFDRFGHSVLTHGRFQVVFWCNGGGALLAFVHTAVRKGRQ